jgi:hypothetical protein
MKTLQRSFLVTIEESRLNKINNFQVVRYFNPSHFDLDSQLILHLDYSEGHNINAMISSIPLVIAI